jgi:hypothetical protein
MEYLPDDGIFMEELLIFCWVAGALSLYEVIDCPKVECNTML